jgi:hypothetical protein
MWPWMRGRLSRPGYVERQIKVVSSAQFVLMSGLVKKQVQRANILLAYRFSEIVRGEPHEARGSEEGSTSRYGCWSAERGFRWRAR